MESEKTTSLPRIWANGMDGVILSVGYEIGVPSTSGVYVILDLRGPLYVGRSCNLQRRFNEHITEEENPGLAESIRLSFGQTMFYWIEKESEEAAEIEKILIHRLNPACNRVRYTSG